MTALSPTAAQPVSPPPQPADPASPRTADSTPVTGRPTASTDDPTTVTADRTTVTSDPTTVTGDPTAVTDQTIASTDEVHTITDQPTGAEARSTPAADQLTATRSTPAADQIAATRSAPAADQIAAAPSPAGTVPSQAAPDAGHVGAVPSQAAPDAGRPSAGTAAGRGPRPERPAGPSLSPSRAADFKTCPLLFRFRTIDKLPETPSADQVRGTLVHAVLERLFDLPAADRTPEAATALVTPEWERLLTEEPALSSLFATEPPPRGRPPAPSPPSGTAPASGAPGSPAVPSPGFPTASPSSPATSPGSPTTASPASPTTSPSSPTTASPGSPTTSPSSPTTASPGSEVAEAASPASDPLAPAGSPFAVGPAGSTLSPAASSPAAHPPAASSPAALAPAASSPAALAPAASSPAALAPAANGSAPTHGASADAASAPVRDPAAVAADADATGQGVLIEVPGGDGEAARIAAFLTSARDLLGGYFAVEDPRRLEPAERETLISTMIGDDDLLLRGYIDRLDVSPAGDLRVVDYKTGGAPREAFEGRALFQLKFYALVLWRTRGVVPRALRLLYLKDAEALDYSPDQGELERFERTLLALSQAIERAKQTHDFRPKPSRLCGWCSHQALCPEFGGTPPPYPQSISITPLTPDTEPDRATTLLRDDPLG